MRERLRQHLRHLAELRSQLSALKERQSAIVSTRPGGAPGQDSEDRHRVQLHPARQPDLITSDRERRSIEDNLCTAGMRNPSKLLSSWPSLRSGMQPVRLVISNFLRDFPAARGLALACGDEPQRPRPEAELVGILRGRLATLFGIDPQQVEDHHPASPLRFRLFQAAIAATEDPDHHVGEWLEQGAPMGIQLPVTPGGHFPLADQLAEVDVEELPNLFTFSKNHASFTDFYDEAEPPTLALIRSYLDKGFGDAFPSLEAAKAKHGSVFPAPLGDVRKRNRAGGWKHRVIQDLRISRINDASTTAERTVLPRPADHGGDLAQFAGRPGIVASLVLDYEDAFMMIPLHDLERKFNCAVVEDLFPGEPPQVIVWKVLGFGGRANPLVYARIASCAARTAQGLCDPNNLRLQLYVDDPALTSCGTEESCHWEFDHVLWWWLALGLRLAWGKGALRVAVNAADRGCPIPRLHHDWIGVSFYLCGSAAYLELTAEFVADTILLLGHFCRRDGQEPLARARSVVGKSARIAQVVPDARPFAGAMWAALTASLSAATRPGGEPPSSVPCGRFFTAAAWLRALLRGTDGGPRGLFQDAGRILFPLRRCIDVLDATQARSPSAFRIEFDASPWGGGGVLFEGSSPVAYWACQWDFAVLDMFKATIGCPKHQTLWEFISLLISMVLWAHLAGEDILFILGDNVGALECALQLRGRGPLLIVARELAWRKACLGWHFAARHLPSEQNVLADALSRLHAVPPAVLPSALLGPGVRRDCRPAWEDLWAAWIPPL